MTTTLSLPPTPAAITCSYLSSDFTWKSFNKSLPAENPHLNGYYYYVSWSQLRRLGEARRFLSIRTWLCGHMRRDEDRYSRRYEMENGVCMFGSDQELGKQIPTQAQSNVEGSGTGVVSKFKPVPDVDYLQELLAIQQQGPRAIGFFGTRNMGFMHQELIEILSYAMVVTKNHIYTSGASGTNAAVIRGALRAEKPELLTVILPQSLKKQPPESEELLSKTITEAWTGQNGSSTDFRCKSISSTPETRHSCDTDIPPFTSSTARA